MLLLPDAAMTQNLAFKAKLMLQRTINATRLESYSARSLTLRMPLCVSVCVSGRADNCLLPRYEESALRHWKSLLTGFNQQHTSRLAQVNKLEVNSL